MIDDFEEKVKQIYGIKRGIKCFEFLVMNAIVGELWRIFFWMKVGIWGSI